MRYQTLLPAIAFLGALGACTDQPTSPAAVTDGSPQFDAAAPYTRTEFEGFIHFCESLPPEEVTETPGGILLIKGLRNQNEWVTGNPLIDGPEENVVDGIIDLNTGNIRAQIELTVRPRAVDGTWELRQTLEIIDGVTAGRGSGHGTGDLQGMNIAYTVGTNDPQGGDVCDPDLGPPAPLRGFIVSPADSD